MCLTWNKGMQREGQTNEGRKLPPVLQLKATPPSCLALVFLEGEVASSSQQRMLCEHQGDTKNLPLVLISVKTNQLIVHLLCKNSLKISQHPGIERHCQLQTLQTGSANSSSKAESPQNRLWETPRDRKQVFS